MTRYLLLEHLLLLLQGDVIIMLDGDHDGVDSLGDHRSLLLLIMHSHLWGKGIRRLNAKNRHRPVPDLGLTCDAPPSHAHLCFRVRTQPGDGAVASEFGHLCVEFVG